ncbi:hypothetical protein FH972_021068 [Carpinus fangiana]|uniref:Rrn9 domain-containing protein n=1 Tax=Carpinus fangiana TaxID=176857 RepID=A0A5N6KNU6_9ROSI|nr:hypothetical protein FH972_021068 [Carpinus fangiana]
MSLFGTQDDKQGVFEEPSVTEDGAGEVPRSAQGLPEDASVESEDGGVVLPKYPGGSHKWRRLTKLDRQVAQAQEKLDDHDLSIHLYDTHAIKACVRRPSAPVTGSTSWQSKERWRVLDEWVPSRGWTAWPLPESDVPRPRSGLTQTSHNASRSSQELEHCILATMMKHARADMKRELEDDMKDIRADQSGTREEVAKSDMGSQSEGEHTRQVDTRYDMLQIPLPLADDEKAWDMLHPAVRRTMAGLDSLLRSMHQARQSRKRVASDDDIEHSGSESARARSKQNRRSMSVSTSRKRSRSKASDSGGVARVVTRDWSEVLGHAGQSGWDKNVVERAARKCSQLFGESMNLHPISLKTSEIEDRERLQPSFLSNLASLGWQCPETECKRHLSTFKHRRMLNKHMREEHGYSIPWIGQAEEDVLMSENTDASDSQTEKLDSPEHNNSHDQLLGGIHMDGFLQPVIANTTWCTPSD